MAFVRFGSGSAANGPLAKGCEYCIKGSKMVLLVTGKCRAGCFYCPVSAGKKGKDTVFANEGPVSSDEEVIEECTAMAAEGAGITGGDPSEVLGRTLHYIKLLKERFGKDFHIHMYTSVISLADAKKLEAAGLDEIRYHPKECQWTELEDTELASVIKNTHLSVGVEVPALPGKEDVLTELCRYAFEAGAGFVNLNELEFSESNWNMMASRGYSVKDDISAAVLGSEETALKVMKALPDLPIHFCASSFKDSVQLRNRLKRRAENTAREYDVVTDDGTFLKGIIYSDDPDAAAAFMREEYGVPDGLMFHDRERNRLEIAAWILEEVGKELPFRCCITEEYPTKDRLEVERTPINRRKAAVRAPGENPEALRCSHPEAETDVG